MLWPSQHVSICFCSVQFSRKTVSPLKSFSKHSIGFLMLCMPFSLECFLLLKQKAFVKPGPKIAPNIPMNEFKKWGRHVRVRGRWKRKGNEVSVFTLIVQKMRKECAIQSFWLTIAKTMDENVCKLTRFEEFCIFAFSSLLLDQQKCVWNWKGRFNCN